VIRIKICGLTRPDDVAALNRAGGDQADLVLAGFVFAPGSRRLVTADQAHDLRRRLDRRITAVGVFRDAPVELVAELVEAGTIDWAQLHGAEPADYIRRLKALVDVPVVKAVAVAGPADLAVPETADPDRPTDPGHPADYLLFDHPGGGSGHSFDLAWIDQARAAGRLPAKPFFIAGGLREDNLARALARHPYGVDLSSGAETNGRKDPDKISRLVRAVARFDARPRPPAPSRIVT
jgi:phosphoribosylanthranilate isomerase